MARNQQTTVVTPPTPAGGEGALKGKGAKDTPATFDQAGKGGSAEDVVRNYKWTLSKVQDRDDIPEIKIYEHRNTEPAIKRQVLFYGLGLVDQLTNELAKWSSALPYIGGALGLFGGPLGGISGIAAGMAAEAAVKGANNAGKDLLAVYDEIFPDSPTGNSYTFPYFSKTYMELTGPKWEQMDELGESIDSIASGAEKIAQQAGFEGIAGAIGMARTGAKTMNEAYKFGLKAQYPVVGIYDRPRIFASHNERDVTIEFPLFNTHNEKDWIKNRDLIYKLMTQFLYIKKSYITGLPPVFYRVLVPYQYFSFASCITNFKVENLGNMRKLYGMIVPDAYQVSITLSEMVMPSLNQFQYAGRTKVDAR